MRALPHSCLLAIAAALLPAAPAASAPKSAREETKRACIDASEQGQELRDHGKLLEARERFRACSAAACPQIVRKDCAGWLVDVEERIPTVVLGARDPDGRDLAAVRVVVDGAPLVDALDGQAIPLDPGVHSVRFEWTGGAPVDLRVVLREGEKRRALDAQFLRAPVAAPSRPVPIAPIVLGGVALAAGAAFTGLALSAKSDFDHLQATCAPHCAPAEVDPVRAKLVAANVSLGVSIAALGVGAVLLAVRPGAPGRVAFGVSPTAGGAMGFVGGSFSF
ncbi:hypothetical protein [Polyangium aurulentum]|uniref:hypothetical protein n=1 Tax=Polyangium aurulentum TaxID=2567896 RepID=UPI0010AEE594|nr:hypothetical protein [Polyangium aurulentum]UQA56920.1 hypothetical protein E8A73_037345 [Polyangium aurulentum]